jgi:hypothetical protein
MKSLCITGSIQSTLDQFAAALIAAGSTVAVPALRNEKISIAQWHEKALATQTGSPSAPVQLGRTWDQLAVDIFYANHNQPVWLWAEEKSHRFLQYWSEFDKNIHFVLMHTSPQAALIAALNEGKENLLALEAALENWCQLTQAMLSFHISQPARSVFFDSVAATKDPALHIKALDKKWLLSFKDSLPKRTQQTDEQHLDLYLINNLVQRHKYAMELHNEVQARQLVQTTQIKTPIFDQVIADHIKTKRENFKVHTANTQLEARLQIKQKELQIALTEQKKNLSKLNDLSPQIKQLETQSEKRYQDLIKEHNFETSKNQKLLASAVLENELLLGQLHHTQETLALKITEKNALEKTTEALQSRIKRILEDNPGYWELETLKVEQVASKEKNKEKTLQWHICNVYLGEKKVPELTFQTRTSNGVTEILLQRPMGRVEAWPLALLEHEELLCAPNQGSAYQGNNETISKLGSSDWSGLLILVKKLIIYLQNTQTLVLPVDFDKNALVIGLYNLEKTLANWPKILRYDDLQLSESAQNDEYRYIGIKFNNLSLGQFTTSEFHYKIATVDESTATFGQHPRIEFPESSQHAFKNWFIESDDERGARLELRFSQPTAMDTNIWNQLPEQDQILVASLISNLPIQLKRLQHKNPHVKIAWKKWHTLSSDVKTILSKNTSTARAK